MRVDFLDKMGDDDAVLNAACSMKYNGLQRKCTTKYGVDVLFHGRH